MSEKIRTLPTSALNLLALFLAVLGFLSFSLRLRCMIGYSTNEQFAFCTKCEGERRLWPLSGTVHSTADCQLCMWPGCWPTHQKLSSFLYRLRSPPPPTDAFNADHRVHGRKHHGKSRILRKEKTQATFNEFIWWVGTKWVFKHRFSRLICGGEQS